MTWAAASGVMPMYIPRDVFEHILSCKDPQYELVCGGGKTPSARAMPLNADLIDTIQQEALYPLPLNTVWIKNGSETYTMEKDKQSSSRADLNTRI